MPIAQSSAALASGGTPSSTSRLGDRRRPERPPRSRIAHGRGDPEAHADPLASIDPDLHGAVRDAYRCSIRDGATQRQAFDAATDLLSTRQPQFEPAAARRLVARLLAHEPTAPAAERSG